VAATGVSGSTAGVNAPLPPVARALANDPPILLADEPTGNLDTRNAGRVADVFERLVRDHQRTVVMVTHNPELAARTDRRIRIVDGRIVEDTGGG